MHNLGQCPPINDCQRRLLGRTIRQCLADQSMANVGAEPAEAARSSSQAHRIVPVMVI
jgi:hypothetical protein